jgi:hypothetical protein
VLKKNPSYNIPEEMGNDLTGLANFIGHFHVTAQIHTQKPLGALQDEIKNRLS